MGRYKYTEDEKDINKVLKFNELRSNEVRESLNNVATSADKLINESEELLKSLGYGKELLLTKNTPHPSLATAVDLKLVSWDELLAEAESLIDYDVELEDILSAEEIQYAYQDLERINKEFTRKVKLNKTDISFLIAATALQTLRWILMPELGEKIDTDSRTDDKTGDSKVKEKKDEYAD